jgi:hypothetical protein
MSFRDRLQRATERGRQTRAAQENEAAARALSEEECRRLHAQYRNELNDHIEKCLSDLAETFPGFRLETIVDESGWGAGVSRDDFGMTAGKRNTFFSRMKIVVSPYSSYRVLAITAKGTVRNKESLSRNHYQPLADADMQTFRELIETWALDYAELYAAAV